MLSAYMEDASDLALAAIAAVVKDVGCYNTTAIAGTVSGTGPTMTFSAPHGLSIGDKFQLKLPSAVEGLKTGWIFTVKTVPLSTTVTVTRYNASSGAAWAWTGTIAGGEALKVIEDEETRAAVTWTLGQGLEEDPTVCTVALAKAETYDLIGFDSASTGGIVYAYAEVPAETLGAAGSVEIKRSEFNFIAGPA